MEKHKTLNLVHNLLSTLLLISISCIFIHFSFQKSVFPSLTFYEIFELNQNLYSVIGALLFAFILWGNSRPEFNS